MATTRQKLSEQARGRKLPTVTPETRQKMRLARLGSVPANKGIPHTEAQRQANRAASTTKRAVYQLALDGTLLKVWPSIKEAAEATGATRAGIRNTILGKSKHAAGFQWTLV